MAERLLKSYAKEIHIVGMLPSHLTLQATSHAATTMIFSDGKADHAIACLKPSMAFHGILRITFKLFLMDWPYLPPHLIQSLPPTLRSSQTFCSLDLPRVLLAPGLDTC